MPLSEEQILRYSRQILLKEVGGKGQEALLRAGIRVVGEGSALQVAAAYLGASGVSIEAPDRSVLDEERGFTLARRDERLREALAASLGDLNPDSQQKRASSGVLAELCVEARSETPAVDSFIRGESCCVVIIGDAVIWRGETGCARCFEATAASCVKARVANRGASAVAVGALAALCSQRLTLGLAAPIGAVALGATPVDIVLCAEHG